MLRRTITAARRPDALILGGLLFLGLVLRLALVVQWRPAFVGYSDSGIYFQGAFQSVWADPIRTVGYAFLLDVFHTITPHLAPVIALQHALGLAAGVGLYLTVRRTSAPAWVALLPAAWLLLGGSEVFLEHAALSEGFFTPLFVLGLYAAVRAPRSALRWAVLAGLCVGFEVALKGVALALIPTLFAVLLFSAGRPTKDSLLVAGLATACALLVVGGYVGLREHQTNLTGLTTNGNWNLYGRIAPFADCTKFTPPKGTEALCADDPAATRKGRIGEYYIFDNRSPGIKFAGPAYAVSPTPDAMKVLGRFSRAVLLHQRGAYLHAVWSDALRLVDIDHPSSGQASPVDLRGQFQRGLSDGTPTGNGFVESWRSLEYPKDDPLSGHHAIGAFVTWDRWTTPRGPIMLVVLLLAAVAPFLAPRGSRYVASVMASAAWVLLLFPIVSKGYDYRFVIPTVGPLVAAAAFGAWGISERVAAWRGRVAPAGGSAQPAVHDVQPDVAVGGVAEGAGHGADHREAE